MDKESLVSVIIAVYNAEKYLRECLDSIINQTYKNLEIICVNDGSKDNSLRILEEYAGRDSRVKVVSKENEGLGGASARNLGLDLATGQYISILDSDDLFEPDMYESAVKKAEETQADMVVFGGDQFDDKLKLHIAVDSILNSRVIPGKIFFSYRDCKDKIFQLSQGMAWNKLYRRSFLEKKNLRFQRIKFTDDAYFTFAHMVLAERITVVDKCFCHYRVNTGSSQTDGLSGCPDSAFMPYTSLKEAFLKWGVYDDIERSFVNCAITFMRYFYDKIGNYEAFDYLHEKLRNEVFHELDVYDKPKGYFYDKRVYDWVQQVIKNSPLQLAFSAVRAYGTDQTTGILRFPFPQSRIPKGSRIALIGAEIMGRNYYAQIILSRNYDVAVWVDEENCPAYSYLSSYDELKKAKFDYAVIAYTKESYINRALQVLDEMGFDRQNVIVEGDDKK